MTEKKPKEDHLLVGSVVKTFRVLEAFDKRHTEMGFSEISRITGLERSACQRAAHTLWHLGYLDKIPETGEYRLALRCHDLGMRFSDANRIVSIASPYIALLRKKTTASVNLTMLDGPDTVFVQRNTNPDMAGNALGDRGRLPAYCTATGIAMLAQLDAQSATEILRRSDLKPVMPNTVWELERILKRISDVRKNEFALGIEEDIANDITIASGFRDPVSGDVGAIGLSYFSGTKSPDDALRESRDLLVAVVGNLASDLQA